MGHPDYLCRLSLLDRAVLGIFLRVPEHRNRSIKQRETIRDKRGGPCCTICVIPVRALNMTSFYGSSCANNGKDALNTPDL
eukprot:1182463-Prorocentrum_minimum.AAC.1